ncbi:MAG: cupin domain-containing protein, partial [Calditrichia bacterium]
MMKSKESVKHDHPVEISDEEIVVVRPQESVETLQKLPYYIGISQTNAGSRHLSLNLVVIPAGSAAEAHLHNGYETAVYILKGKVKTRYGEGLKKEMINQAGDFLFIPPNVPHQPVNLSDSEAAHAIVARNDPNEQE